MGHPEICGWATRPLRVIVRCGPPAKGVSQMGHPRWVGHPGILRTHISKEPRYGAPKFVVVRCGPPAAPPKVIWVRLGNCSTAAVEMLLRNSQQALIRFEGSEESCLMLGRG